VQCLSNVRASLRLGVSLPLHLLELVKDELELLRKHLALLAAGRSLKIVRPSLLGQTSQARSQMYG